MLFFLFVFACFIAFASICLLQFVDFPLFIVVLVCMHVGIALFIVSKKLFIKKCKLNVKKFYLVEYGLLALYLPILAYKLLSKTGWYSVNVQIKTILSLIIAGISVIVSIINAIKLYKFIYKKQNNA